MLYTVRCAKADRELHQVLERGAPSITRELAEALGLKTGGLGEDEERKHNNDHDNDNDNNKPNSDYSYTKISDRLRSLMIVVKLELHSLQ